MTIRTLPVFYYVEGVNELNNLANFLEPNITGSVELTASFIVGSRSPEQLAREVARGFNAAGGQEYTVTFDRDTRTISIGSTDTFDLLASSGSNTGVSIYGLLGFDPVDLTGQSSYTAQNQLGREYLVQFLPQGYRAFEDNLDGIQPAVRETASGVVEVITFGNKRLSSMEIRLITNRPQPKESYIQNNPTGLQDARDFMEFIIQKGPFEFMRDRSDRSINATDTVILERTRTSRTGTSYVLRELVSDGLEEYYTTGTITFRKLL